MAYPNTLSVHVTQEDIDEGIRCDCRRCPIARAVSRVLNITDDRIVRVAGNANVFDGSVSSRPVASYYLSQKAEKFICQFDSRQVVAPTSFRFKRDTYYDN